MEAKKILVVLPHPDDEVFPMSGTLAQLIEKGAEVTYACLTLGEMGRNLGNPPFANRVTLPQVRIKELEASCGALGIKDLRMLGFHDKTIEFEPHEYIDGIIREIVEEVQPDTVFTFYPGYGVHPDHNACGAAVIRVIESMSPEDRPIVYCTAFPTENDLGSPNVVNDITKQFDKKLEALKAHSSQFNVDDLRKWRKESESEFMARIRREQFWVYPFKD